MASRPMAMVVAAFLALAAASCHSDDDDAAAPARTTTTRSPESEVESAYLGYWDMFVRLTQSPDSTDPEIAERASGDAFQRLVDGLTSLEDNRQKAAFGPLYSHDVVSVEIDDDESIVRDCAVDDSHLVDLTTGQTLPGDIATDLWQATLVRGETGWLVDSIESVRGSAGAVPCA